MLVAAGADGLPVLRIRVLWQDGSRKYDPMNALRYYRCTGADGYRFSGKAVCHNGPVRGDQLEQAVWDQVQALLEEPHQVAGEYRRRITQARDGAAMPEEIVRLDRQITSLRRGIGRLIDSYTEGVIDKTEFEPWARDSACLSCRSGIRPRSRRQRPSALVISRLEDFSAKVAKGLDNLDRIGMQDIIRTVVRRIEIDDSRIEVIFRVPPPDGPPGPRSPTKTADFPQALIRVYTALQGRGASPITDRRAPRKIGSTRRMPQNCPQMIPLRSRSDLLTFTPRLSAIDSETNFSRSLEDI